VDLDADEQHSIYENYQRCFSNHHYGDDEGGERARRLQRLSPKYSLGACSAE